MTKRTSEVFGISNEVLPDSYVDRGELDAEISKLLSRPTHLALRGESKCGKSWLRQQTMPDALVVQCRLEKSCVDVYTDALSQLGVRLEIDKSSNNSLKGRVEAEASLGTQLFAKLGIKSSVEEESGEAAHTQSVGKDINDLRFVADLIKASERTLVIEDFHYMSVDERKRFAFDLKALWDYGLFVVVVGVWSQNNLLVFLNPDLTGRVNEIPIYWSPSDLEQVLSKGGSALNVRFADDFRRPAVEHCFGNVGILQKLALGSLDAVGIHETQSEPVTISDASTLETAAMDYAEQLNPLYQQFAARVSSGIRKRADTTGIYAHAMAVVLDASDEDLVNGLHIDDIFERAHARQSRIQKGNLKQVLDKFDGLQVDEGGRGLVLSYSPSSSEVFVVDRQLLLYRKYSTVKWPWEEMIAKADQEQRTDDGTA